MQFNNKFFKGTRAVRNIAGGAIIGLAGLLFAGVGIYFLINPNENLSTGACIGFIALGGVAAAIGIISIIFGIRSLKKIKPLSEEQIKENEAKFSLNEPEPVIIENEKLYFHFGGKMNQSYYVENINRETIYECRLVKFNPFLANTYEFVNSKNGLKKTYKVGKVMSIADDSLAITGNVLSSRFNIDGVMCWDYLRDRGYELKFLLGESKTFASYELVKLGKLVARIYPANYKDPFSEDNVSFLKMGKGMYRLEINEGKLDDIVMAAFIISQVEAIE